MAEKAKPNNPFGVGGDDNVNQIREIIFGGHIRDYEERFKKLESSLKASSKRLHDEFKKDLDSAEKTLAKQLGEIETKLNSETKERDSGLSEVESEIKQFRMDANNQFAGLEDDLGQAIADLRKELKALRTELLKDADKRQAQLSKELQQGFDNLQHNKVSRTDLAGFFQHMAGQLEAGGKKSK